MAIGKSISIRTLVLTILTVIALGMAGTVVYVLVTSDARARAIAESADDTPPLKADEAPKLYFKESLRSYDPALNRFIDRLIRTTREGRYDEFRRMWTRQLDPISLNRYQAIWKLVREVDVVELTHLDAAQAGGRDAYLVKARITVDDAAAMMQKKQKPVDRERHLLIVREEGQWVLAPNVRGQQEPASDAPSGA